MRSRPTSARHRRWVGVRIHIASGILFLLFGGIAYRAYGVQVIDADHYRRMAARQHLSSLEIASPRGAIRDNKGGELAVTVGTDSIYASPREVVDRTGTAESLTDILNLPILGLEAKLSSARHFVWLKRHVTPDQASAIRDLEMPGIHVTSEPRRYYPAQHLAGTVIGFADIDGVGIEGIEKSMDEILAGERAILPALRDARGRLMLSRGFDSNDGASITLTIDRPIQYIAERTLARTVEKHQAKAGTIVVMDVDTSAVLAIANVPSYDPNSPAGAAKAKARNRAITDVYEIGSPLKVLTIAAALDSGVIRPTTVIDVENGRFRIGSKVIKDSHRDASLDITGIIRRSSNVGAVKIAYRVGAKDLHAALLRFGFGSKTGIELPGERAGRLRAPEHWGKIGLATIAFGYGVSVTPLQVTAAFAAVANGGTYHEPRIVKLLTAADGHILYKHAPNGRRVIKQSTALSVRRMLATVFDKGRRGGTARSVDVVGYRAGGKTGTAHKYDPKTHRYSEHRYLASFVGIAPIDAPRIAVLVLIDEPGGEEYYGAKVAGPAFASVVSDTLRYLGVPPDKPIEANSDHATPEETGDEMPGADILTEAITGDDGSIAPSFRGLGLRRALDLAERDGIAVEVSGSGRAVSQTCTGNPLKCHITFSAAPR